MEHSPEKLTGILQTCQDHERKENSEELSETQEKKQLNPNENLYKILVQKKQKDITTKVAKFNHSKGEGPEKGFTDCHVWGRQKTTWSPKLPWTPEHRLHLDFCDISTSLVPLSTRS